MKQYFRHFLLIGTCVLTLAACDTIEAPFEEGNTVTPPPPSAKVQHKVLIEEYTGFKCKNCPEASHLLHKLQHDTYGDRMIVIGVHALNLAEPDLTGDFTLDLRVSEGEILANDFLVDHVPVAGFNRNYDANTLANWSEKGDFSSRVATLLEDTVAKADITISPAFNPATRQLNVEIKAKYLQPGAEGDYLSAFLVEDNVVAIQDSNGIKVFNYLHRNVLRAVLNSTYGEQLTTALVPINTTYTKNYTYTVPAGFNISNCSIIAFVHNKANKTILEANTKTIIQ